jgi:hypothetical protein
MTETYNTQQCSPELAHRTIPNNTKQYTKMKTYQNEQCQSLEYVHIFMVYCFVLLGILLCWN